MVTRCNEVSLEKLTIRIHGFSAMSRTHGEEGKGIWLLVILKGVCCMCVHACVCLCVHMHVQMCALNSMLWLCGALAEGPYLFVPLGRDFSACLPVLDMVHTGQHMNEHSSLCDHMALLLVSLLWWYWKRQGVNDFIRIMCTSKQLYIYI
jgi:hypothetical protein